jgi:hypothetical protein
MGSCGVSNQRRKAADDKFSKNSIFKNSCIDIQPKNWFSSPTYRQYTFFQILLQISHKQPFLFDLIPHMTYFQVQIDLHAWTR